MLQCLRYTSQFQLGKLAGWNDSLFCEITWSLTIERLFINFLLFAVRQWSWLQIIHFFGQLTQKYASWSIFNLNWDHLVSEQLSISFMRSKNYCFSILQSLFLINLCKNMLDDITFIWIKIKMFLTFCYQRRQMCAGW